MLAFAAFLLAPGVTYEGAAAPASTVLAAIGKAAGTPLSADAKLAQEVLLVHAKEVSLDDLMRRIAAATGGEWKDMDTGGYRLFLSPGTDAAQRREEDRARVAAYRTTLDQWGARDAQMELDEYRRMIRAGKIRPKERHMGSLFEESGDDLLANIRPGRRIVLSTAPTARQTALPPGALARLQKLSTGPIPYGKMVESTPPPGPPTVGWITLRTEAGYPGFDANVFLADAEGRIVGWSKQVVSQNDPIEERKLPALTHPDAPVALDAESAAAAQAISLERQTSAVGFNPASETYPNLPRAYDLNDLSHPIAGGPSDRLLRPERFEPLAWGVGAALAQVAEGEAVSIVASIPDDAFVASLDMLRGGKATAQAYLKALVGTGDLAFDQEAGWLVAHPRRPATARDARLDRAALGATMRALAARGGLTLDEQAAEAFQPLVDPADNFEVAFIGALNPAYGKRAGSSVVSGERLTLRLFRALGGEAGIRQSTTKARAVGSLPADARRWLEALVYDSDGGPDFKEGPNDYPTMSVPQALAQERTFRWPNGIPTQLIFVVTDTAEDAYYGLTASGSKPRIVADGWTIGVGDEGRSVSTSAPRLAAYAKGHLRTVLFTIQEGDKPRFTRRLEEDRVGSNPSRIAFDDLPEPLRKNILSAEEGVRKTIEDQRKARTVAP